MLSLGDIEKLFAFNEATLEHDFTFDFASFSYFKKVRMIDALLGTLSHTVVPTT